jgi:aminoglycoside/choline kinase family phosphotransferase
LKELEIIELSKSFGYSAIKAETLKLEASGREYYRIYLDDNKTLVICYLDPKTGNHSQFLHVATYFDNIGINASRVVFSNVDKGITIQEDLGDQSLIDIDLNTNQELLIKSMKLLSEIQTAHIPQIKKLNETSLKQQMNSMQSIFLTKFLRIDNSKELDDLELKTIEMLNDQPWMNCHFDYERRNLILDSNNSLAVIDFQDLCIAPIGIDLAGILIDHYHSYSKDLIEASLKHYIEIMKINVSINDAFEWVRWGAIQRNMRILGTLSKLYTQDNRDFRLKDLPSILDNLIELIPQNEFLNLKDSLVNVVKPSLLKELNTI